MKNEYVAIPKDLFTNLMWWLAYGINNHPDQVGRSAARAIGKEIEAEMVSIEKGDIESINK